MKDLIERLENATGPDSRLDEIIALSCGYKATPVGNAAYSDIGFRSPDGKLSWGPPKFTASLDAALTLVPEGCAWACGYSRFVPHNAEVYVDGKGAFIGECDSNRATALVIASLKARAASERDMEAGR